MFEHVNMFIKFRIKIIFYHDQTGHAICVDLELVVCQQLQQKAQRLCLLAGYLNGAKSVCALQQGHFFSSTHLVHFFPQYCTPFLITIFTNMFIMNTYVDNKMYYFIIICLGDIIMDYDAVQCLCIKE